MPTNVMVGYDGSPAAGAAINAGAELFPDAHVWIAFVWGPPFAGRLLRRRLRALAADPGELADLITREGQREADAIASAGVALARAVGWDAEPVVARAEHSPEWRLVELADKLDSDVLVVGDFGAGESRHVVGDVCDTAVHHAAVPVLMVPNPLLTGEAAALAHGPVVVGYDGSPGADAALRTARRFWPQRTVLPVAVRAEGDDDIIASDGSEVLTVFEANRVGRARDRSVADALIQCGDDADAAVLAVGSRGWSALQEVLLGNVATAVVRRAHRAVFVVRA